MKAAVFFSPRVLTTINALPVDDREAIASAITSEFILGADVSATLTPQQYLVMAVIRQYVERDTQRLGVGQ